MPPSLSPGPKTFILPSDGKPSRLAHYPSFVWPSNSGDPEDRLYYCDCLMHLSKDGKRNTTSSGIDPGEKIVFVMTSPGSADVRIYHPPCADEASRFRNFICDVIKSGKNYSDLDPSTPTVGELQLRTCSEEEFQALSRMAEMHRAQQGKILGAGRSVIASQNSFQFYDTDEDNETFRRTWDPYFEPQLAASTNEARLLRETALQQYRDDPSRIPWRSAKDYLKLDP